MSQVLSRSYVKIQKAHSFHFPKWLLNFILLQCTLSPMHIQPTFCNIHLFFTYFLLITSTKIAACIHRAPAKKKIIQSWREFIEQFFIYTFWLIISRESWVQRMFFFHTVYPFFPFISHAIFYFILWLLQEF